MTDSLPNSPEKLKAALDAAGISKARLAELSRLTVRAIDHYLAGSRPISNANAQLIKYAIADAVRQDCIASEPAGRPDNPERLRAAMRLAGLSPTRLAGMIHTTPRVVASFATGRRAIPKSTVRLIEQAISDHMKRKE